MKRLVLILVIVGLLVGGCGAPMEKETPKALPEPSAREIELERKVAELEQKLAESSATLRSPSSRFPRATQPISPPSDVINWDEAKDHIGEETTVCGTVMGTYYDSGSRDRPTYFNIGKPYPDPGRVVVVIRGRNRTRFPQPPEEYYLGKSICVTGTILLYEGIPWIIVEGRTQIEEQ